MKKIAVINDLSGFGKCSLTAAVSVISVMGVQPCPFPTAILSAQTGYSSYFYDDYTDRMDAYRKEWEKLHVRFDGIYTGFMSGSRQIEKVFEFLDSFYEENTFLLVDPVMGDEGERFPMFSDEFQKAMRRLVLRADVVTPNFTELCLLTDTDYTQWKERRDREILFRAAEKMAYQLMEEGPGEVVVTGIRFPDPETGEEQMGNLTVSRDGAAASVFPFIGESFSGTGDLFASAIAGGKARGDNLSDVAGLAGQMIEKAILDSVRNHVPRNEGVDYERYLWMLAKQE